MHPYLNNAELLEWCNEKGIHVTAYAPLGNVNPEFASALEDPIIAEVATSLAKSPAQVQRVRKEWCDQNRLHLVIRGAASFLHGVHICSQGSGSHFHFFTAK